MPPSKERVHNAMHMSVDRLVGWLVGPSVTFSFSINHENGWGHWVKGQGQQGQMCQNCFLSVTRERFDLPSSYLVHRKKS